MTQAILAEEFADPAEMEGRSPGFDDPALFDWLVGARAEALDALDFGVVTMAPDGTVEHYNVMEGRMAGLTPSRVVGRNFFTSVAPCTNNFMVAERYRSEPALDHVLDYVFTLRMSPQKVRLRLLKRPDAERMFLIVERRR